MLFNRLLWVLADFFFNCFCLFFFVFYIIYIYIYVYISADHPWLVAASPLGLLDLETRYALRAPSADGRETLVYMVESPGKVGGSGLTSGSGWVAVGLLDRVCSGEHFDR
jgi:hypothetical protein